MPGRSLKTAGRSSAWWWWSWLRGSESGLLGECGLSQPPSWHRGLLTGSVCVCSPGRGTSQPLRTIQPNKTRDGSRSEGEPAGSLSRHLRFRVSTADLYRSNDTPHAEKRAVSLSSSLFGGGESCDRGEDVRAAAEAQHMAVHAHRQRRFVGLRFRDAPCQLHGQLTRRAGRRGGRC